MARSEFRDFFESQNIPADYSYDQIAKSWGIINNSLSEFMPSKLFRYRKIRRNKEGKDYTFESLKAKTIGTCSAKCFTDKYDSLCYFDEGKVADAILRLINRDTINAFKKLTDKGEFPTNTPSILKSLMILDARQLSKTSVEEYTNKLRMMLLDKTSQKRIIEMFKGGINYVRNDDTTQIACFTESVASKYMWDTYADAYKGYALEYDFRGFPLIGSLLALPNELTHSAILPVFYSDERYDLSNYCVESFIAQRYLEIGMNEIKPVLHNFDLLDLIRPYLYKSLEYSRENEWRLICKWGKRSESYAYIPEFDMLRAVYYGPEIPFHDKEELHKIAISRSLKEYQVKIDDSQKTYELDIISI